MVTGKQYISKREKKLKKEGIIKESKPVQKAENKEDIMAEIWRKLSRQEGGV